MRLLCIGFIILLSVLLLCACTGIKNEEPLYIYAVGLDRDEIGVKLYVLAGDGRADIQSKENKENGKTESSNKQPEINIISAGGGSVENAFGDLLKKNGELYTGTVKKYVVGNGFDDNGTKELEIFLASTGKFPVKRNIERQEDPYLYLQTNAELLLKK